MEYQRSGGEPWKAVWAEGWWERAVEGARRKRRAWRVWVRSEGGRCGSGPAVRSRGVVEFGGKIAADRRAVWRGVRVLGGGNSGGRAVRSARRRAIFTWWFLL